MEQSITIHNNQLDATKSSGLDLSNTLEEYFSPHPFKAIFESSLGASMLLDAQYKVLVFNQKAAEMALLLFNDAVYIGKNALDYMISEAARQNFVQNMGTALAGSPVEVEQCMEKPISGQWWLRISYIPVKSESNEIIGVNYVFLDIDQQKKAELAQFDLFLQINSRFSTIFEACAGAKLFIDPGYRLVLFNQKAIDFGQKLFKSELCRGQDIRLLLAGQSPEVQQSIVENFSQSLQGEQITKQVKMHRHSGLSDWFSVTYVPVHDAQSHVVIGGHIAFEDINHLKRGEQILLKQQRKFRDSENRFWSNYESITHANVFFSLEGKILAYNQMAVNDSRFLGNQVPKIGKTMADYLPPDLLAIFNCSFGSASRGKIHKNVRELNCADGLKRWFEVTYSPVKDANGNIIGVNLGAANIDELKNREQQIQSQNEQLRQFAHLTSHSLRGPVASILTAASWMDAEPDRQYPAEVQKILEQLKASALHLDSVIHDMMQLVAGPGYNTGQPEHDRTNHTATLPANVRVMLIDDDPMINAISHRFIGKLRPSAHISQFLDPSKALDTLLQTPERELPQVIFLDLQMPQMNGWEFLEAILAANLSLPVYLLSSSRDPADQMRANQCRVVKGFLFKPISMEKLKIIFP